MERLLLLKVEERFQLTSRGLVLVPEVSAEARERFKNGDEIRVELVRPDGTSDQGRVRLWYEHHRPGGFRMMCFPEGMTKEDVPIGTEVWALLP